jgi:hypothetical protein
MFLNLFLMALFGLFSAVPTPPPSPPVQTLSSFDDLPLTPPVQFNKYVPSKRVFNGRAESPSLFHVFYDLMRTIEVDGDEDVEEPVPFDTLFPLNAESPSTTISRPSSSSGKRARPDSSNGNYVPPRRISFDHRFDIGVDDEDKKR